MEFLMHYDQIGDALYVDFTQAKAVQSKAFGEDRVVDYGSDGKPVGVEFFNVSQGIDTSDMPLESELTAFLEKNGSFRLYA